MRRLILLATALALIVGVGLRWPHLLEFLVPSSPAPRHATHGPAARHAPPAVPPGGTVSGIARVVDGDTLDLSGHRIRLFGIDAPERGQTCHRAGEPYRCGTEATRWLERAVDGREVRCTPRDRDRSGRLVAECRAAGRGDLGEAMVRAGWAVAYRRYSDAYGDAEAEARAGARGLWAGTFEPPEAWRRGARPRPP